MDKAEWSRSRFWLGHFLYSRHDRPPVPWQGGAQLPTVLGPPLVRWLRGRLGRGEDFGPCMIAHAIHGHAQDPAYIQAVRLWVKERGHHRHLYQQLIGCLAASPSQQLPACNSLGRRILRWRFRLLGARFEMSVQLLDDLVDLAVLRAIDAIGTGPTVRGVCEIVRREKQAHLAFTRERLTLLYADFNFIRRNLRRLRLRTMCVALIWQVARQNGPLLHAAGTTRIRFMRQTFQQFSAVLEHMVPYRRQALLAALVDQRREPYAEPSQLTS